MAGRGTGGHGQQPVPSFPWREGTAERVHRTVLDNGVEVLTEDVPGVRSAAVGVWVRQGGAHENADHLGVSHLLEHMVFKGTRRRTAREIALSLERLGGSLDAYTTREHTSFQARVLDEHLPVALDVLADLVLSPTLRDEDLELEREVVLEEIAQVEDTPDDLVFDLHAEALWQGHPYGAPILGTPETVGGMSGDAVRGLHADRYVGRNLVVAAAGRVDQDDFVRRVEALFGDVAEGRRTDGVPEPGPTLLGEGRVFRPTAQTHLVFGTGTPPHADPRRYAVHLVSTALGGGMSSRLFQRVREELALCYSVFSFQSFFSRAGMFGVYVGTRPETADAAVQAVREELERMAHEGLGEVELEEARQQTKGQVMLSLESTGARLHRLASAALHGEPFLGLDGLLERLDGVTEEAVAEVAEAYLDPEAHYLLRLGPDRG